MQGNFFRTLLISKEVRIAIRLADLIMRPYVLREFSLMIFEAQFGKRLRDEEKERLYGQEIEKFQEELRKMANTRKTEIINNGTKKVFAPNEVESFLESG